MKSYIVKLAILIEKICRRFIRKERHILFYLRLFWVMPKIGRLQIKDNSKLYLMTYHTLFVLFFKKLTLIADIGGDI
ncbi:hypothetical protein OO7_15604 [Providencia sneebia DSM 19967]|uniref:Uncharacterized protein n=1 Tax=Providencia sneebia DSM 19967 TaxID=1141660 RepID=K8W841_9GAMM|nr:hypothetical protein OO7_15604 [Providencia sneebia DSM 19967]